MRPLLSLPLWLAVLASPAVSQSGVELLFNPDPPCFSRNYDAAHLDSHPHQQVTMMVVTADTEDMALDSTDDLLLLVDVMVRGVATPYSGVAYCSVAGDGLDCFMEGDAGGFSLTPDGKRLRLAVGPNGLSFEADDFLTLEPDKGDDRVFLLDAGICG